MRFLSFVISSDLLTRHILDCMYFLDKKIHIKTGWSSTSLEQFLGLPEWLFSGLQSLVRPGITLKLNSYITCFSLSWQYRKNRLERVTRGHQFHPKEQTALDKLQKHCFCFCFFFHQSESWHQIKRLRELSARSKKPHRRE